MIAEQKHIINKVFLEVDTNSTVVAYKLKDNLDVFLKDDILPYLEQYIKSIEHQLPAEIVQIPQINLEINVSSDNNFEALKTDTREKLVKKICAILKSPKQSENLILMDTQERHVKSLLFFIKHGYAPWWKTTGSSTLFTTADFKRISSSHALQNQFVELLKTSIAKKRSILQFTNKELQLLLQNVFKPHKEVEIINKQVLGEIKQLGSLSRVFVWTTIIDYLLSKKEAVLVQKLHKELVEQTNTKNKNTQSFSKITLTILKQLQRIQKETKINLLDDDIIQDISNQEKSIPVDLDGYYIQNAGLVIVHPYLPHFFQNCGLLDSNNTFKDREVAAHALHYLATKKEQQLESNLVFEKFICGIPIVESINRHIILTDDIKNHAEELLKSIIENWDALGNASTDLLGHEFLQREGKLSFKDDNPKIIIERKTQDILVDKLPWGISLFKLPWFDKLIFTNW